MDPALLKAIIQKLPPEERIKTLELLELLEKTKKREKAQATFLGFVRTLWADFIFGHHHKIMADAFDSILTGNEKRVAIAMPPRHPVWTGHLVTLASGQRKTVGEIVVGDRIVTHDGTPKVVLEVHEKGFLPTLKIKTHAGRELYANDVHPFLTPEGWVDASDLKIDQHLAVLLRHLVGARKIQNEEARLLGYLIGDGVLSNPNSIGIVIDESEIEEIEDVNRCCGALGFSLTKRNAKHSFGICGANEWARSFGILDSNAYEKRVPRQIFEEDSVNIREFLSGYFITDGAIASRGYARKNDRYVGFASVSKSLMQDVQHLLLRIGVSSRLREKSMRQKTKRQGDIYTYYSLDITDQDNAAKLINQISIPHSKRLRFPNTFRKSFDIDYYADRIVSIERVDDREHRCFHIEDNHTFTIEDVIVHNTKSMFSSVYLPAMFLGKFPNKKIIQASHTAELAVGFGRQVRNIIDSPEYQEIFPGVELAADAKAAGRWNTNKGGEYYAIGAGGAVSGKGADLLIIDDPHSEQDAILAQHDPTIFDKTVEWYESGPRQRLQPKGAIIITATRWGLKDLTGQLIKKQTSDPRADKWKVIELPAIMPSGKPLWPEFWSLDELLATKASIPVSKWNAQYQQTPVAEEGALIKREWWQDWDKEPPKCDAIIQSWDTAFTAKTSADYSVCTTWGVFETKIAGKNQTRLILLDMIRGKWEFPDLKKEFLYHYTKWKPGICLIEARASGQPLIYELRSMGIPVQDVTVGRGSRANPNDKISRLNAISDIFASRMVYLNKSTKWADEVMEEIASFPHGEHDDIVDSTIHALTRFRHGGWIGTELDDDDEDEKPIRRKAAYY